MWSNTVFCVWYIKWTLNIDAKELITIFFFFFFNNWVSCYRLRWAEQRSWHGREAFAGWNLSRQNTNVLLSAALYCSQLRFIKQSRSKNGTYLHQNESSWVENNSQVEEISVANKRREEFWILMSVEAHELAIKIWDEQGDQMGISAKLVTESETIPNPYSLKSDWKWPITSGLTSCFFFWR